MCTIKGKVCPLISFNECACETKAGYEPAKYGIWKTVKGWFSLYELQKAASQGEYFEWYLQL